MMKLLNELFEQIRRERNLPLTKFATMSHEAQNAIVDAFLGIDVTVSDDVKEEIRQWAEFNEEDL